METKITATELARSLSDILNRVRYRGERFVVERNGEIIATLAPAAPAAKMTLHQFIRYLKEKGPVGGDFADNLEDLQRSQPPIGDIPEWR
jgi:antitoxin (DNA-binding transcriptional repressor) of toxin-antitoxin stability system